MASDSKSSSSSSTATTNQDLRVGADNAGIALGQGASINLQNQFPDSVSSAFNKLIELASGAGQLVADTSRQITEAAKTNQETTQTAISALTQKTNTETQGTASVLPQVVPYIAAAAVAIVVIIYLMRRKNK